MDEAQAKLIAEQLGRMQDSINARFKAIEEKMEHYRELDGVKIAAIAESVNDLKSIYLPDVKEQVKDHETRLRAATEGVTQFKTWFGGGSVISVIFSIVSLIKSLFVP